MSFRSLRRRAGSQGGTLTDFSALQRAGAVAVTDDGKPILDDDVMRMALRLGAELNFPVVQHAEDTRVTENCSMHAGPTSFRLGLRAMPASAEATVVDRDVTLAQQIRESRLHVAHLSTADALKAVRRGKARQSPRDLRSHSASLHADRRKRWRVRHEFQDESAAAFGD